MTHDLVPSIKLQNHLLDVNPFEVAQIVNSLFRDAVTSDFVPSEEIAFNLDGTTTAVQTQVPRPIPLLSQAARQAGLTEAELKKLAEAYPSVVGRAVEMAMDVQKEFLVRKGLNKEYDSSFAKFVAVNLTSMRDKSVVENQNVDVNQALEDIENEQDHPVKVKKVAYDFDKGY